jgi:hypothetical protein
MSEQDASKLNNVETEMLSFDFKLFIGGRFTNPLHLRILNVLEIEEQNSTIISIGEIVS